MSNTNKGTRLSKAAREFNVGTSTIVDFLGKKGYDIENKPNTKLSPEIYDILIDEFQSEKQVKEESKKIGLDLRSHKTISIDDTKTKKVEEEEEEEEEGEDLIIKNIAGTYKPITSKKDEGDKKSREEKKEAEKKEAEKVEAEKKEAEKKEAEKKEAEEKEAEKKEAEKKEAEEKKAEEEKKEAKKAEEVEKEKAVKKEAAEKEPVVEAEATGKEKPQKEEQQKEPAEQTTEKKIAAGEATEKEPVAEEATEKEEKKEAEKPKEGISLEKEDDRDIKILGKIDLKSINMKTRPDKRTRAEKKKEEERKKAAEKILKEQQEQNKKVRHQEERRKQKEAEEKKKAEEAQKAKAAEEAQKQKEEEERKARAAEKEAEEKKNFLPTHVEKLTGPKILDKIDLPEKKKPQKKQPVASSKDEKVKPKKKKRKRIQKTSDKPEKQQVERSKFQDRRHKKKKPQREHKPEVSEEEIQKQIKETLSKLSPTGKSKAAKYRRQKRADVSQKQQKEQQKQEEQKKTLKVTEFVSVNELANMMTVPATDVISTCMSLGLFVSINQRLDAETLSIVAEEFGYEVEFVSVEVQEAIAEQQETEKEQPEDLVERPPIVTVMGHVDHGKTKLLDYVRHANVVAGEAGGITQHIGAYEVQMDNGKRIVFLDTPGHEAFTAMRARGAKVTDVAVIVVAADDNVMPQTKEAINHAQAAGVPLIFAINKVDKPSANPERIKQELSEMNILVEDWGGKYQSQEISAKTGQGIEELMEKILLESELLELKGNPKKLARGTIIESSLDKGRGYVTKILVQNGNLKIGDMVLAGAYYGKAKAMYNERNQEVKEAGPSTPVLLLGLNGAPQAGDMFNVMRDEREAKEIANKRQQLQREQGLRTQKHITLDEIGRRIAIGDFKQLNVIVKGDVDGSVEALSDSLLKLSNEEVQVEVIHKSVGAITESDVLLASASDAIIVGFQVRPSPNARKLAENEQIDIRLYSIIYQAIEELKAAIEGMLSPDIEEKITCNVEVRDTFRITKVGTVAGCMVLDGKITRNTRVRIIRDGIVVYTGNLGSLKRYKDDVKEVNAGYECGLNIENFNDIKVGDIIEGYEEIEVKRKL